MKVVPYSSVVGNLMYAQVCTRPDIAFVVNVLGSYLSDLGQSHWKAAKKVLRYLQGTKDLMLTYRRTNTLEMVGFRDSDYAVCMNDKKSTFGYIFMMAEGVVSWKSVKPQKIQIFEKGKTVISVKNRKFSRSWMTKRNKSHEI